MTQTETREDHGLANALAWFQSIKEMVDNLRQAEERPAGPNELDEMQEIIRESVLSVELRGPWYGLGDDRQSPTEYRILLSTGGPACQLVGKLNEHGAPESARLEHQDWGTPWTEVSVSDLIGDKEFRTLQTADEFSEACDATRAYLLTFARQFYFGEG